MSTQESIAQFTDRVVAFYRSVPDLISGIDDRMARARAYRAALHDAGLAGVSYPTSVGGQGLGPEYEQALRQASLDLLPGEEALFGIGIGMAIPTIAEYATPELQQRFIRPALRGEEIWCQLYSEPGAGSDLERLLREEYGPMIMTLADCPIPTIAAVNGPAAGAGANLALAADVVIASDAAYFMQAFARIVVLEDHDEMAGEDPQELVSGYSDAGRAAYDEICAGYADIWAEELAPSAEALQRAGATAPRLARFIVSASLNLKRAEADKGRLHEQLSVLNAAVLTMTGRR